MKLVRSSNVVAYWREKDFLLEDFLRRRRVVAAPHHVRILEAFGEPRSPGSVTRGLAPYSPGSVRRAVRELCDWGFLVPARSRAARSVARTWRDCFPAAYCHFVARDIPYTTDPGEISAHFSERQSVDPQPDVYKEYPGRRHRSLPRDGRSKELPLSTVLRRRRTIRDFGNRSVSIREFAKIVRGTWGQTGWIDGGVFGRLLLKTSPSAGARHPIECYVAAWRVSGLQPGLYHYSVRRDRLERLRAGDLREIAVELAGGQEWVRGAAFLCIMTAVADRVFWKYPSPDAHRLFLLDAGHLGQTFSLLATAAGLGPFTTAAMKESAIEKLLEIDGVEEFPIYLCGAGRVSGAGKNVTSSRRRSS
jgi:SagB-type dehydrogenase family enzyme